MAQIDPMKIAANQAVHLEVRAGLRPHANTIPCSECGHVYKPGERRHEWHHHLGYKREHWFSAIVVCTTCHGKHSAAALKTQCKHGHEFTPSNTARRKNGTRECRACSRARRKKIRTAKWWRERRARKAKTDG